ncbi:MAG: LacI family DNA-binding transcriptional regulator [Cyclobacteriaceae bacterium]
MRNYVTISSIARELGLSHSTVSRALRDHPRISKTTKLRVKQFAKERGYYPTSTGNRLKESSKLITVIVPNIAVHFFAKVIENIQRVLEREDFDILLVNTMESYHREKQAIESSFQNRVSGVIASISSETTDFQHYQMLLDHEIPLVFFDRVVNFLPAPKIVANDYQAAYDATHHLIISGCKRIAHITGSGNLNNSNNRLYGYLDALRNHNIQIQEDLVHYYEFNPYSIDNFLKKALLKYNDLDGIFVFHDYAAHYTINLLQKWGKRIPEDISIMGFSDEPLASYRNPKLSTVQEVANRMGQLAGKKMMSLVKNGEPMLNEKVIIEQELVLRETTNQPIEHKQDFPSQ